jgi:hypothetical protein
MDILVFSIITNFVYYSTGYIFLSQTKLNNNSVFLNFFIGAIILSFIGLLLNFFIPLSPQINSLIYVLIIIIFLLKNKLNFDANILIFLIIASLITFFLLIKSNVNRPDAGLYHLPYISLLNENKIIFGLSNIHFRFSHVSIMQYLSAMNNNFLFFENGVSIPLASLVSFFYVYFFYDVWKVFRNREYPDISKFFSLFILIYISYKINRYSGFGNDAVGHLSYFYLISYILKNNLEKINFDKVLLISVFIFINKPMLGLVFFIPLILFFIKNNFKFIKILNPIFSLPTLLLCLWLIKNIITSGCVVFPIKTLCIEKLPWTNIQRISEAQLEGEAWSKAWPDKIEKNISMEEFNKDFNWVKAWSKKHLKYILNIIIPYTIVLSFIIFYVKYRFKNSIIVKDKDLKIRLALCVVTGLMGTIAFFYIFPIYRYGYSYIISLITLLFLLMIRNILNIKKNIFVFKFFFIICFAVVITKQIQRISINNTNNLWPNIYTLDIKKNVMSKRKINIENNFYYYLANKGDQLCMYSRSPCTTYKITDNIKHIKKYSYSVLILD